MLLIKERDKKNQTSIRVNIKSSTSSIRTLLQDRIKTSRKKERKKEMILNFNYPACSHTQTKKKDAK